MNVTRVLAYPDFMFLLELLDLLNCEVQVNGDPFAGGSSLWSFGCIAVWDYEGLFLLIPIGGFSGDLFVGGGVSQDEICQVCFVATEVYCSFGCVK